MHLVPILSSSGKGNIGARTHSVRGIENRAVFLLAPTYTRHASSTESTGEGGRGT